MLSKSPIIKFVLFGIFAFGIGVIILNSISYGRRQNDLDLIEKHNQLDKSVHDHAESIATKFDSKSKTKSSKLPLKKIDISKVSIRKYKIPLNNETHANILVREAGKGNKQILLLHGQNCSSKIWEKIGTFQYLSNLGYQVFAIDIPYSENNSLPVNGNKAAVKWLKKVIETLHLSNLSIISPLMSGRLTLPYMFHLNKQQELIRSFVYIDPIGTEQFNISNYEEIEIPTLIIHDKQNTKFQSAFITLKNIPTHEILFIKNIFNDSYYENRDEFHYRLRQFLDKIYRPNYKMPHKYLARKKFFDHMKKKANYKQNQ
ncbi:unnamed protein product [Rotaria sp. Silwood2]|nr:unnamed protein product [Rotaria sp. Silwood2]CAF4278067.1 unnamed protein product [Rotaria sp. Silwood2]